MDRTTSVLGLVAFLLGLMGIAGAHRPGAGEHRRFYLVLLAICTLAAAALDLKIGHRVWRPSDIPFGHHDVYHYYFGSKYLPEVRYDGFYAATWVAIDELRREGHTEMGVRTAAARDLSDLHTLYPMGLLAEQGAAVKSRFPARRWERFKKDLLDFAHGTEYGFWEALSDRGYNGTPALSLVLAACGLLVPAREAHALPLYDLLLLAVTLVILWRTFDAGTALAIYLFIFSIRFSSFTWFSAVYLRMLPFALVAGLLCALHRGRFRLAGVLGGAVTALNLTPITYLAGAFAHLCLNRRYRHAVELAGASALTALGLVVLTSLIYGPGLWLEFLTHIKPLSSCLCLNNFGLDRLLVPAGVSCQEAMARVNGVLLPWRALGGAAIVLLLAGFRRVTLVPFTALFASTFLFLFTHPLSYYSYFFAFLLLAVARPTAHEEETEVTTTSLVLLLAAFPAAFLVLSALEPENRFPFAWLRSFNGVLFSTYTGMAAFFSLGRIRGLGDHMSRLIPVSLVMIVPPLFLGPLRIPPPSEAVRTAAWIDLSGQVPLRIENLVHEEQPMAGFGSGWFLDQQVIFQPVDRARPGAVSYLVLRPSGEIDLHLTYTAAPDYGPVVLDVTSRDGAHHERRELSTDSDRVEARTVEMPFPAGQDLILTFTFPPAAPEKARFGLDHVLMIPRGGDERGSP